MPVIEIDQAAGSRQHWDGFELAGKNNPNIQANTAQISGMNNEDFSSTPQESVMS